jgi:hypothetical protein
MVLIIKITSLPTFRKNVLSPSLREVEAAGYYETLATIHQTTKSHI